MRRVKEGTSAVLLQSGLDVKSSADSMECFCYLRHIQDLLSDEKTSCERRFGIHLKPRLSRLEQWWNITLGASEGSSSTSRQDSSWYNGEAKCDFWSISEDFSYRHHVEPRVKLFMSRDESFPIPLKYIDVARNTCYILRCDVGEKYGRLLEC